MMPLLMMVFAMPMMGMMGTRWGHGMGGGLSPLWGVGTMLFGLLVLLGVGYLFYRGLAGSFQSETTSDPALEELRITYARGELIEEEYEERRSKLQGER